MCRDCQSAQNIDVHNLRNEAIRLGGFNRTIWEKQLTDDERDAWIELARASGSPANSPPPAEAPFVLTDDNRVLKTTTTMIRPRQSGFRAQVLGHYGCNCAVCDVVIEEVIEAAHLCPKSADGSDHVGNGLPLCRTHHKAMDAGLFAISPTLDVVMRSDRDLTSLGITRRDIRHLPNAPNPIALAWLWDEFCPNVHQSENNS